MKLRNYQTECITRIYRAISQNRTKVAVSLPTGAGKSIIISKIVSDAANRKRKSLILVHRKPLVKQLASTLESLGIKPHIIASGFKSPNKDSLVTIAMVQTLDRRKELPQDIGLIILDEAHITTYFKCFERCLNEYLGSVWALSKIPVIGFSATFWRTNKKEGYCKYFHHKVQGISPRGLINKGFLTPPKLLVYDGVLDSENLEVDASGDFSLESIRKVCNEQYMDDVIDKWFTYCKDLKTILFTSSVPQASYYLSGFRKLGVITETITGTTSQKVRDSIFQRFKAGLVQVIINVGVLTEGYDEPSIECVVLARPTKSAALIVQMIGRGLRLYEGKQVATIVDVANSVKELLSKPKVVDEELADDIFEYNDFTLCSTYKPRPWDGGQRFCQVCDTKYSVFLSQCPHCGNIPEAKPKELPDSVKFPDLIEYRSGKEAKLHVQLRKDIFTSFVKDSAPQSLVVSNLISSEGILPPAIWCFGAIFKDLYPEFNYPFFQWFLECYLGLPNNRVEEALTLEFGSLKDYPKIDFTNYKKPNTISLGMVVAINKLTELQII